MKPGVLAVLILVLIGAGIAFTYHPAISTRPSSGPPVTTISSGQLTNPSSTTSSVGVSCGLPCETASQTFSTSATSSSFTSGSSVIWVGADAGDIANTGLYSIIQVEPQTFGGCLSFWVSDQSFGNGVWAQIGYFVCQSDLPEAFVQVWNLNSHEPVGGFSSSVSDGDHNFSMYQSSGTT